MCGVLYDTSLKLDCNSSSEFSQQTRCVKLWDKNAQVEIRTRTLWLKLGHFTKSAALACKCFCIPASHRLRSLVTSVISAVFSLKYLVLHYVLHFYPLLSGEWMFTQRSIIVLILQLFVCLSQFVVFSSSLLIPFMNSLIRCSLLIFYSFETGFPKL